MPSTTSPPALAAAPPLFVVFNARSGHGDAAAQRAAIEAACRAAQRRCTLLAPGRVRNVADQARHAAREACMAGGIVVAAGGDGTVSTVAQAALEAGAAFGVLPLGTFNYYARTHGVPTDLPAALDALLAGAPRATQAGLVNERVFLVNASIGWYARSVQDREAYKSRFGRSRLVALGAAVVTLLRGARRWALRIDADGLAPHELHTPTLFVGNNALQLRQVGVDAADAVERAEGLGAIALAPLGRVAMLGIALRAALGRLGAADGISSFAFRSLHVRPARGGRSRRVRVAIDGEQTRLAMPLHFRVAPEPLWLVAVAPAQPD